MEGEKRRQELLKYIREAKNPISGTELAKRLGVSRQVIVQDIALLRAVNKNILSTNKGYLLYEPEQGRDRARRTVLVQHTDEEMADELYTIVDFGGTVLDVVVEHDVYGQLTGDLILRNRQDVEEFLLKIQSAKSKSLMTLTSGRHMHTIEAESEGLLDVIVGRLQEKGYILTF